MPAMKDSTWGYEREGYAENAPVVHVAAPHLNVQQRIGATVLWEERVGSLIAGGGGAWVAYAGTLHGSIQAYIWTIPGPLELCAVGVLIWLHAKWRRWASRSVA
jgi:hypothetical protein